MGLDAVNAFAEAIRSNDDGNIVLELEHDVETTDLATLADQITAAKVEAVAVWSTQPAFSALAAALQARNWEGILVYGYLTPDLAQSLGQISFEILGPVTWWANAGDWVSLSFNNRYTQRYGEAPIPQAAAYYDAVYLIASQLVGNAPPDVQTELNGVDSFIGVQGSYHPARYNNGELTRQVLITSLRQGVVSTAARYDDGQCLIGCGN
jgi:ABC-type branched-subunit amino acid transport system substrate-binding protein